jgi:hypothetical protein
MDYTAELTARIEELIEANWRTVKAAAESVGITEKPADSSWNDIADDIAISEFKRDGKAIYQDNEPEIVEPEPVEGAIAVGSEAPSSPVISPDLTIAESLPSPVTLVPEVRGSYPTEWYKSSGIPSCEVCGERYLSDLHGAPLCPENFSSDHCPRLSGDSE